MPDEILAHPPTGSDHLTDRARITAVGQRMLIDRWTVDIVDAFRTTGIDAVLLKGPVIARWLYDDPVARGYSDADLLVRRSDLNRARTVLTDRGFSIIGAVVGPPWSSAGHAETWFRERGHAAVDLHRCLHGLEHLADDHLFEDIWRDREQLDLGGHEVPVPAMRWRVLHLVLHLQPKDHPGTRPWNDVVQALGRVEIDAWRAAARLAADLGVTDTMGPLLRLVEGGSDMADALGLPVEPSSALVRHHRRHAPGLVRFGYRLRDGGLRRFPHTLRMAVAPPVSKLSASYPVARRGTAGLVVAYAWRVVRLPAVVLRAVRHQLSQRVERRLR